MKSIGTFSTKGTLLWGDPCSMAGSFRVKPGTWVAHVTTAETGWGERVASLVIQHKSETTTPGLILQREDHVIVDSGQAGFIDVSVPIDGHNYDEICRLTSGRRFGGVYEDRGVFVCSGLGDGYYPVEVAKNADGETVQLRITFIDEDEIIDLKNGNDPRIALP